MATPAAQELLARQHVSRHQAWNAFFDRERPEIARAELIGGVVYRPSPTSVEHGDAENNVGTWIGVYRASTPGTASGNNTTSFLLEDCPQPDVNLRLLRECGGGSWVRNASWHGSPELLAEVWHCSKAI